MTDVTTLPVLIAGAGGHAKVLLETVRAGGGTVYGLCDTDPEAAQTRFPRESIVGADEAALALQVDSVVIAVGVGATRAGEARKALYEKFTERGFAMATAIHPSAVIADGVMISAGVQIMAGAVIQPDAVIGANAVVNTGATIDHDCRIGDHAFIAPGVTLCGGVSVGAGAHVGAGATILEYRSVGENATVGGGALVDRDVAAGTTVCGVPAKAIS
jgi:sugar O-acyltransferase (sialic acid O-acetyltransferase NeuD family)